MSVNKIIQCLVVDDEPPAREIISRYISEMSMLKLAGECSNALQALDYLQSSPVDLIFLDIQLPQLKGNDFLKILKNPPRVIFTTAHPEYALEGYELDVVDYLLKPIQFDRFVKSVHKAIQMDGHTDHFVPAPPDLKTEAFVYFRSERKMVKVMLQDILYIESMKDYVKIFTTCGLIITKQSITSVEEMLPEKMFIRSHRSFIVSVSKIRSFTNELVEIGKSELPIGKMYRNSVMKALG